MIIISATSPAYASADGSVINLTVLFEDFEGPVPFTASALDTQPHGAELFQRAVDGDFGPVAAYGAPAPVVPVFVEMVQARLALLYAGHLGTVKAAIAAMPGIEGDEAREMWEFAPRVRRDSTLVASMGALLGLDAAALDALFIDAAGR